MVLVGTKREADQRWNRWERMLLFLFIIDNDHKILGDGGNSVTDAVSDFEPLRVRVGIPITIGSASACAGSYSYCCHKRLSFVTVEMQLLQG